MLVLARKIGQQVVLPDQGITIDIVEVGRTQVRLGISAPAHIPIHRREVWDRDRAKDDALPASGDSPPDRPAADELRHTASAASSFDDLDKSLARWITKRTNGRINRLSVETRGDRIVIHGSAQSFYARQLAQAAVQEVFDFCGLLPRRTVEYSIDIGDDESTGVQHIRADSGEST